MHKPDTFSEASAQAAAIPDSVSVALCDGTAARVMRLSWLQFEALWNELASLLSTLALSEVGADGVRPDPAGQPPAAPTVETALATAPQFVLALAAQSLRMPETQLAAWPPCDVLAVAAASLELNFIRPAGVRDFFSAVARLGS